MEHKDNWLALVIGNSRMHWAWFEDLTSIETWNTRHLFNPVKTHHLPELFLSPSLIKRNLTQLPVYLASVVPQQTAIWQGYQKLTLIDLRDIKLTNIYSSMGIDRALAAWGAIAVYQQPCLIVDGGTALTFTGVDEQGKFIGGAILPGLRSQLTTLSQKTSALPEIQLSQTLPTRWALNTDEAIASGVIYTAIASIRSYIDDWLRLFPTGKVVFTGGDGVILISYLHQLFPELTQFITVDLNLIFWGTKLVYQQQN